MDAEQRRGYLRIEHPRPVLKQMHTSSGPGQPQIWRTNNIQHVDALHAPADTIIVTDNDSYNSPSMMMGTPGLQVDDFNQACAAWPSFEQALDRQDMRCYCVLLYYGSGKKRPLDLEYIRLLSNTPSTPKSMSLGPHSSPFANVMAMMRMRLFGAGQLEAESNQTKWESEAKKASRRASAVQLQTALHDLEKDLSVNAEALARVDEVREMTKKIDARWRKLKRLVEESRKSLSSQSPQMSCATNIDYISAECENLEDDVHEFAAARKGLGDSCEIELDKTKWGGHQMFEAVNALQVEETRSRSKAPARNGRNAPLQGIHGGKLSLGTAMERMEVDLRMMEEYTDTLSDHLRESDSEETLLENDTAVRIADATSLKSLQESVMH